jgi:hypothetical protein
MASGHVNRANRPNTWPQPTNCTVKKTLANGAPFSNRASVVNNLLRSRCYPESRFSPRSAEAAATSGPKHRRCNVHNGLA